MENTNDTIVLQVDKNINRKLAIYSKQNGLSINTYVLNIVEKELNKGETIYVGEGRFFNKDYDIPILNSPEFYNPDRWLWDKAKNQKNNDSLQTLSEILDISNRIFKSRLFSTVFMAELDKVVSEVKRHVTKGKRRKFTFPTNKSGFNYSILLYEICYLEDILKRLDFKVNYFQ
jgi:hypothetical protein